MNFFYRKTILHQIFLLDFGFFLDFYSGALNGKILLVRIIENNTIVTYFRSELVK